MKSFLLATSVAIGTFTPPTVEESFCVNYIATLTIMVVAPPGSPAEQKARVAIESKGMRENAEEALEHMRSGFAPGEVLPYSFSRCLQQRKDADDAEADEV